MSDIKVIGVGYARTGTYSLKYALKVLGYRCYHFEDIFLNKGHSRYWVDIVKKLEKGSRVKIDWKYLLKVSNKYIYNIYALCSVLVPIILCL